eukprot:jgi/Chrpa1/19952/Chrysochromulina_OHIO_Genome00004852-RA
MNGLERPGPDVGRSEDEDIPARSRSSVTRSGTPRHLGSIGRVSSGGGAEVGGEASAAIFAPKRKTTGEAPAAPVEPKRKNTGGFAWQPEAHLCNTCTEPIKEADRTTFWSEPVRVGAALRWKLSCEHEELCWTCALRIGAAAQPQCPFCRRPFHTLRRRYRRTARPPATEERDVASLQREHAARLVADIEGGRLESAADEARGAADARPHQESADAEAARDLDAAWRAEEVVDHLEELEVEGAAIAAAAAAAERARALQHEDQRLDFLAARVERELGRGDWRVWLLACAYAGRLTAAMSVSDARDVANRAMRDAVPLLFWGGAHGVFLYGLAREYGRGARGRGGESSRPLAWMVGLLEASGLRETVACITGSGRTDERATVEVLLRRRLEECKCLDVCRRG